MLEAAGGARCPYCRRDQLKNGYYSGKETSLSSCSACVIKCENCKKDFFSENRGGSINYKIELEDGSVDSRRLEDLKNYFGYSTN